MSLVRGFTDVLNPVNRFGDSFIGGGIRIHISLAIFR
jgi:hypothetical protein